MRRDGNGARCDIVLLVDEEVGERNGSGRFVVEPRTMEAHVLHSLQEQQRKVCVLPFDPKIVPTIEALRALRPRLVFNLTEWVRGNRRLDAAIVGVLEMMNLRYTGAGPAAMRLARDKALAKNIVAGAAVAVAAHTLINGRRPVTGRLTFPLIVKPQFGDGSDEIGNGALVRSERDLARRVDAIRRRTRDPLICEEFIPGRDLFVALLGNEPRVMPPLELMIGRHGAGAPRFATFRVKNDASYRTRWRIRYRQPELPAAVLQEIEDASRRVFHALGLRDYARIDYRLAPDNRLVFLEANPNPDLTRDTFGRDRCFAGVTYATLIASIVEAALSRPR